MHPIQGIKNATELNHQFLRVSIAEFIEKDACAWTGVMNWIAVKVKIDLKKIQFLWFDFNIVIMVHQVNKHGPQRGGGISYFWWVRPKFPAAPVLQARNMKQE